MNKEMENQTQITEKYSNLLTNQRFKLGYSEVKKKLEHLKNNNLIDYKQIEKVLNEDLLLKIKYKTYKKCLRNITIGLILVGSGFWLMSNLSFRYLIIISGIILSVSSFFGILSNKLTIEQKEYLKK
ncbi:hypothetical protein [Tenacibaculum ovolyticum]|uniref:hypothetical protein n=1 Tax=Tenacibaculum ovolyticum TaxID=104270 RepID=UPI0007ED2CEF|nr:hypothetical protein [Tenacibaculum ovolyticum]